MSYNLARNVKTSNYRFYDPMRDTAHSGSEKVVGWGLELEEVCPLITLCRGLPIPQSEDLIRRVSKAKPAYRKALINVMVGLDGVPLEREKEGLYIDPRFTIPIEDLLGF